MRLTVLLVALAPFLQPAYAQWRHFEGFTGELVSLSHARRSLRTEGELLKPHRELAAAQVPHTQALAAAVRRLMEAEDTEPPEEVPDEAPVDPPVDTAATAGDPPEDDPPVVPDPAVDPDLDEDPASEPSGGNTTAPAPASPPPALDPGETGADPAVCGSPSLGLRLHTLSQG